MPNEEQQLSPRAKRYQELDRLAYELGPNMDDTTLFSLRFEEISYVIGMAHLYMLARMGAVSPEMGAKIKRKYILRAERIHTELINARYMYHRQLVNTLTFSKDMNKLTELINNKSAEALPKALEIIDQLSDSYIFSKLYYNAVKGGDYEVAIADVTEEPDRQAELKKTFERLLSEISNDILPSAFRELTEEDLKVLVNRIPPREIEGSNIPKELLLKP